jgi:GT2 family glycosyltransferase
MKTALVIVTYNAPDTLRKNLTVLTGQTRKPDVIIIVNNGKDISQVVEEFGEQLYIEELAFDNIGPAGGFKEGQKKAYSEGYDIVIMADDDAWPADKDTIKNLAGRIEAGAFAAGAWDSDGNWASCSNHYHTIHRSVFAKAGFYFAPFFMMMEDTEFPNRIRKFVEVVFVRGAPIFHPHTPVVSPMRAYLTYRNRQILALAGGKISDFLASFFYYFYRAFFIIAYLRKSGYFGAFIQANLDLLSGKLGRPVGVKNEKAVGTIVEKVNDPKNSLFIAIGSDNIRPPSDGIKAINTPLGTFSAARTFSGKDVIVAFPMNMSYPPPTMFARDIYWFDARTRQMEFVYRNNPLLTLVIAAAVTPLAILALPLALLFFALKAGYYKGLKKRTEEEDLEYCRKADKSLEGAREGIEK